MCGPAHGRGLGCPKQEAERQRGKVENVLRLQALMQQANKEGLVKDRDEGTLILHEGGW